MARSRQTHAPRSRPWRWLQVLLVLVASLAYLERERDPAMPSGLPMVRTLPEVTTGVHALPARPPVAHAMRMAMSGMAMPPDPPAPPVDVHQHGPNAPPAPHDHDAHCPFCFTAAFALEAPPVALPSLSRAAPAIPERPAVRAGHGHVDRPRARAPPLQVT